MAGRKPSRLTTGRLQSLRLFSTLLALTLINPDAGLAGLIIHRFSPSPCEAVLWRVVSVIACSRQLSRKRLKFNI